MPLPAGADDRDFGFEGAAGAVAEVGATRAPSKPLLTTLSEASSSAAASRSVTSITMRSEPGWLDPESANWPARSSSMVRSTMRSSTAGGGASPGCACQCLSSPR